MAQEWMMVPKYVVINGCLSCKILEPFQDLQLLDIRMESKFLIEPAMKPQVGTIFNTDHLLAEQRCTFAKQKGNEYLEEQETALSRGQLSTAFVDTFPD